MTASTPTRKRETGRERFERELAAYLGFWAVVFPVPMLGAYPVRERTGARVVRRVRDYGRGCSW